MGSKIVTVIPKLLAVFIHLLRIQVQYRMNIILHACIVLDSKIGKDDWMQVEQTSISYM